MKYDKELISILKEKEFKGFWHCFDYLLSAGYPIIDALGISLQQFSEDMIYSNVGFIRIEDIKPKPKIGEAYFLPTREPIVRLIVGIIDDSNKHLSGLYKTYRRWIIDGSMFLNSDIEETCEVLTIESVIPFVVGYLDELCERQLGHKIYQEKSTIIDFVPSPSQPPPYDTDAIKKQIDDFMGIPKDKLGYETNKISTADLKRLQDKLRIVR